jgi:hypothetical protein
MVFPVESRSFLHINKLHEISMHLNAIKLTLFALLALPSVLALPLQDDHWQVIARDHGIIPRDVAPTMSELLQDRGLFSFIPKLLSKIPKRKP